jgi:hypothetical protein
MVGKKGERVVNSVVNPEQYDEVEKALMQASMGWVCDKCKGKFLMGWNVEELVLEDNKGNYCDKCIALIMDELGDNCKIYLRKIIW